jgi:DNA mismatch endonuclease (patch repair protein)
MDKLSKDRRSANMRAVRGKNTAPEIVVRKAAHWMGLRFRLHRKDLPGCPDLVFPKWKTALFVNGCFWHGHKGCRRARLPASNVDFWQKKLAANVIRDLRNRENLTRLGWSVEVVWQCDVPDERSATDILKRLKSFRRRSAR